MSIIFDVTVVLFLFNNRYHRYHRYNRLLKISRAAETDENEANGAFYKILAIF